MSKAEVELPRLCASRDTLAPVLVRFTLCFPVDWNKKAKAESARPDEDGYHRRKVVSKCALPEKNRAPLVRGASYARFSVRPSAEAE